MARCDEGKVRCEGPSEAMAERGAGFTRRQEERAFTLTAATGNPVLYGARDLRASRARTFARCEPCPARRRPGRTL